MSSFNIYEHAPFVNHFEFVQDKLKQRRMIQHIYNILHSCMMPKIQEVQLKKPDAALRCLILNCQPEHEYWATALSLRNVIVAHIKSLDSKSTEKQSSPDTAPESQMPEQDDLDQKHNSVEPDTPKPSGTFFFNNREIIEKAIANHKSKKPVAPANPNAKLPSQVNLMQQPFAQSVVSILKRVNYFAEIPNETKESILKLARELQQLLRTNTLDVLQQKELAYQMLCRYTIDQNQSLEFTTDDFALIKLQALKKLLNDNADVVHELSTKENL